MAEVGLMLVDMSLNAIAFDNGAEKILNVTKVPGVQSHLSSYFPGDLLEVMQKFIVSDLPSLTRPVDLAGAEYFCHIYRVEPFDLSFAEPIIAIHFGDSRPAGNAIDEAALTYHLTARELDALRGVSMGLGNKELAELMNISPNTVKAFLRLIMIKMGVGSRTGLVAKILQRHGPFEEALPGAADAGKPEVRLSA